jgi:hypothetical protein
MRVITELELFRVWCTLALPRKLGRYLIKLTREPYGLERAIFCLRGRQCEAWMTYRKAYIDDKKVAFILDPSLHYKPWPMPDADARPDADA